MSVTVIPMSASTSGFVPTYGSREWYEKDEITRIGSTEYYGGYTNVVDFMTYGADKNTFNEPVKFSKQVTNVSNAFADCLRFNSEVYLAGEPSELNSMYNRCSNFNQPVNINGNNIISVIAMFSGCSNFNQPVSINGAGTISLNSMFAGCTKFNSLLSITGDNFHISGASGMFSGCSNFNQPVDWLFDSTCIHYGGFLYNAIRFNQPININIGSGSGRIIENAFRLISSEDVNIIMPVLNMQNTFLGSVLGNVSCDFRLNMGSYDAHYYIGSIRDIFTLAKINHLDKLYIDNHYNYGRIFNNINSGVNLSYLNNIHIETIHYNDRERYKWNNVEVFWNDIFAISNNLYIDNVYFDCVLRDFKNSSLNINLNINALFNNISNSIIKNVHFNHDVLRINNNYAFSQFFWQLNNCTLDGVWMNVIGAGQLGYWLSGCNNCNVSNVHIFTNNWTNHNDVRAFANYTNFNNIHYDIVGGNLWNIWRYTYNCIYENIWINSSNVVRVFGNDSSVAQYIDYIDNFHINATNLVSSTFIGNCTIKEGINKFTIQGNVVEPIFDGIIYILNGGINDLDINAQKVLYLTTHTSGRFVKITNGAVNININTFSGSSNTPLIGNINCNGGFNLHINCHDSGNVFYIMNNTSTGLFNANIYFDSPDILLTNAFNNVRVPINIWINNETPQSRIYKMFVNSTTSWKHVHCIGNIDLLLGNTASNSMTGTAITWTSNNGGQEYYNNSQAIRIYNY